MSWLKNLFLQDSPKKTKSPKISFGARLENFLGLVPAKKAGMEVIKVIITDDHALYRQGVAKYLSKNSDIEIIGEAGNGQELLDLLEQLKPDIVIMGIMMPVMNGAEAMPIIRARYPSLRVIILSMHSDSSVIQKMMELGANSYLTKEAGSDKIYAAVKNCFENEFYFNSTVLDALKIELRKSRNPGELTEREAEILGYLKEDLPIKTIAEKIDLSPRTVQAIIDNLKKKAGVKSMAGLMNLAEWKLGGNSSDEGQVVANS